MSKQSKKWPRSVIDSEDEGIQFMKRTLADRKDTRRQKVDIGRQGIHLDHNTARAQQERAQLAFELQSKKLRIEEAGIDKQKTFAKIAERKAAIEERSQIVIVPAALAKNLA